jgi:hypothetical protein
MCGVGVFHDLRVSRWRLSGNRAAPVLHGRVFVVERREVMRAREACDMDGVRMPVISLDDLKINTRAAGRHKALADLDNLP